MVRQNGQNAAFTSAPPSAEKDAYWRTRKEKLEAFLSSLHTKPPTSQRASLHRTLTYLENEKTTAQTNNAPFENLLRYDDMIYTVFQELEDLNNVHPESKTDKIIRLTASFAKAAARTVNPIVTTSAKLVWTGASWAGTKLWDIASGEGEKIANDISYEMRAIRSDIQNSITSTIDEIAYTYHEVKPTVFAVGGMASLFGTGALIWNLSHTSPDAAPETRSQLALNDQPEITETFIKEEWNPKIPGLDEKTPKAKHKKNWKNPEINLDTITMAANMAAARGLSAQYAATVALIESGGDPKAHNPSGAKGVYQFIPSTAASYGLKNPFNAVANTKAFIRFTKDNEDVLSDSLGREPSDAEKYLAHQQGADGATKLLNNPDTKAVKLVGKKAIVQNGGNSDMTAREFTTMWEEKYAQKSALLEIREVK